MKKEKIISGLLAIVGLAMISVAVFLQTEKSLGIEEIDIKNMAASANMYVKDSSDDTDSDMVFQEVEMETTPVSVVIAPRTEVYDGLTLDELSEKINRSLSSNISGKGYLIASHCLEKGVDPYMATAIILQETGCKWGCSYLVNACNNVGGQKGSGCGDYNSFNTLDEGIMAFIDNLERNSISYGLTTPETINPKYAEDPNWSVNVNKYIEAIKAQ